MSEQDVKDWPAGDVLIGYDPERLEIHYTTISTRRLLHSVRLTEELQNGDCITTNGVVRPYVDLSRVSLWQRIIRWLKSWIAG